MCDDMQLDGIFCFVEGFEDEELRQRIFGKSLVSPHAPQTKHFTCPHCGKDVFLRSGENEVLELVKSYDPEFDGRDSVFETDVISHHCDEGDLFEEEPPF